MLKKILIGVAVFIIGFVLYATLIVAKKSPFEKVEYSYENLDVKVEYCRPYKKGRVIFGDGSTGALQPNGTYWRLGANAATEITFSADVNFAGNAIDAGTYRMYAVPGAESFEISLNSGLGSYFAVAEPDYALDVLKVKVPTNVSTSEVEQFTIGFDSDSTGVKMNLAWDRMSLDIPITKR
jgi:hypothetical protein